MKKIVTILMLILPLRLFAVIAMPGSGVYGDEFYHYRIDSNGVRLPARIPAEIRQRRFQPAIQTTFPLTGDIRSIVILVEYEDVSFTISDPKAAFERMLNVEGYSENGGTGSARDYFIANSYGKFRPTFDVYGPYVLPNKREYYKSHAAEMIVDACGAADDDGVDFTQYDFNSDSNIDNVFVYYAGHNPAEGGPESAVWPHRSQAVVWSEDDKQYYRYSVDDKWIMDYACTSELYGGRGDRMCGIGTFCHEFSHVLGLDDFYNTINSDTYTIGEWDIMCQGNYNNEGRTPPSYSAYERWMLGWLEPVQLTRTGDFLLEPLELKGQAYLIAAKEHNLQVLAPNPNEYWLLENRQNTGWDTPKNSLPGTGMLITHITFNKGKWDNNTPNNTTPLGYDICEAYYKNPYFSSPSDTYPGLYNISQFYPVANSDDTLKGQELTRIQSIPANSGNNIVFHYGEDNGSGIYIASERLTILNSVFLDGAVTPASSLVLAEGKHLEDNKMFMTTDNPLFQISLDSIHWTSDTLWDEVNADGTYKHKIYVRYCPTESCTKENAILRISTANGVQMSQSILSGESYRPILIGEVEAIEATDITPYSFVPQWTEQADAETYNITLYRKELIKGTKNSREVIVYQDKEITEGSELNGLDPDTDYYYYLTCSEEKGCEKHTSEKGNIIKVRTYAGAADTERMFTIGKSGGEYVAWFGQTAEEDRTLIIFNAAGQQVSSFTLTKGSSNVTIPASGLTQGQLYIVKLSDSNQLKRKGLQAKFIYQ